MGDAETAHRELVNAAIEANTPEPTAWVRAVQLLLAATALGGAIAIALILVLTGPPAPKEATAEGTGSGGTVSSSTKSSLHRSAESNAAAPLAVATRLAEGESGESSGGGETEGGEAGESGEGGEAESAGESESEEGGESLANLSKQGPWAFAIVALLVAAFIATGKSLNFSAPKPTAPANPDQPK